MDQASAALAKIMKRAKFSTQKCFQMDKMIKAFVPPNFCYILKSNKLKIELQTVLSLGSVKK